MPVYEYEALGQGCAVCKAGLELLQGVEEPTLTACPSCGKPIRRIVSQASFALKRSVNADKAADKGFTTYRRAEKGSYERIAGVGPDAFTSPAPAKPAGKKKKVYDLDG